MIKLRHKTACPEGSKKKVRTPEFINRAREWATKRTTLASSENKRLTRREFFKTIKEALIEMEIEIGAEVELFALEGRDRLREKAKDFLLERLIEVPDFNPFPPEFNHVNPNHCYVVVHPGYSLAHNEQAQERYGSYPDYLENLKRLVIYLKESSELTIFAVERAIYYNGEYEEGLSPPNSALILVTETSDGSLEKYIETPRGKRKQKANIIFSFLADEGIKDIRFAGEWAWWKGLGCLSRVANDFHKAGFEIRGIEGCIYPSVPPNRCNEVLEKIYSDTVKVLSTALSQKLGSE